MALGDELQKRREENQKLAQQEAKKQIEQFSKPQEGVAVRETTTINKARPISSYLINRPVKSNKIIKTKGSKGKTIKRPSVFSQSAFGSFTTPRRGNLNYKERVRVLRFQNRIEKEKLRNQLERYKLMRRVDLLRRQGKLPIPKPINVWTPPPSWIHPEPIANNDINSAFSADIGHADNLWGNEGFFLGNDYFGGEEYFGEDYFYGMIPQRRFGVSPLLW